MAIEEAYVACLFYFVVMYVYVVILKAFIFESYEDAFFLVNWHPKLDIFYEKVIKTTLFISAVCQNIEKLNEWEECEYELCSNII